MHPSIIARVLGILLMLFSVFSLIPPVLVSLWYDDQSYPAFLIAFGITFACGFSLWLVTFKVKQDLRTKDGFVITVLFWSVLGLFGALPFVLSESPQLSITDAVFESMSGLTTTGATVMTGLDQLPRSILYYRQQLQWLGGIGIIVIALAILPMLGIGGMQLYPSAEAAERSSGAGPPSSASEVAGPAAAAREAAQRAWAAASGRLQSPWEAVLRASTGNRWPARRPRRAARRRP
jgi:Trk-type K+ transport system membrane component